MPGTPPDRVPPSSSRETSSGGGATRSARPVALAPPARTPSSLLRRRAFLTSGAPVFEAPERKEKSAGRCRRFFEAQDAAGSAVLEFAAKRTASRNHLGAPRTLSPSSGLIEAPVAEHALAVPRAASTDVLRARAAVNASLSFACLSEVAEFTYQRLRRRSKNHHCSACPHEQKRHAYYVSH